MSKCCGESGCSCVVQAGGGITIEGSGSSSDPFTISSQVDLRATDNAVFNVTVAGAGTTVSPWAVSVDYAATAKLDDIPDVFAPSPTNGYVLTYNVSLSRWEAGPPATLAPGLMLTDGSLSGDGSAGAPLQVREDANRGLTTTGSGLGLDDQTISETIRHFADEAARDAADPAPLLNALSMLDTDPGVIDLWDGAEWVTKSGQFGTDTVSGEELLVMSGAYDGRPPTLLLRNVSVDTDVDGVFDVLSAEDLLGRAGVLSVVFQPTGSLGFTVTINPDINAVTGLAYRVDTGEPYASQSITGLTQAWVY